jgi:hypothetical protein
MTSSVATLFRQPNGLVTLKSILNMLKWISLIQYTDTVEAFCEHDNEPWSSNFLRRVLKQPQSVLSVRYQDSNPYTTAQSQGT